MQYLIRNILFCSVFFAMAPLLFIIPELAYAVEVDWGEAATALGFGSGLEIEIGWALCKVSMALQGTIGKAISTIAVIVLGIGAFFGKVTWGVAVTVCVGVFLIFGSMQIVSMFAANSLFDLGVNALIGELGGDTSAATSGVFNNVQLSCFLMGARSIAGI